MISVSSALTDIAFTRGFGVFFFSLLLPVGIIMAFGRAWLIVSEAYHFSEIYTISRSSHISIFPLVDRNILIHKINLLRGLNANSSIERLMLMLMRAIR